MEFEFLEEEQLTIVYVCPRRTDDGASSRAIGAAWRVPRAIAETLAKKINRKGLRQNNGRARLKLVD